MGRTVICRVGILSLLALSAPAVAHAQTAPPAADESSAKSAPPVEAKDVVRLKNGGLLRGTIAELVPDASVTIVTVAGSTRQVPMAEVSYAGPAAQDPSALATTQTPPAASGAAASGVPASSRPYVTVNGAEARLHLMSEPPGLTFHRQSGSAELSTKRGVVAQGYDRLCTSPCDITMPAGTEVLALSEGEKPPISGKSATFPAGSSDVTGRFVSRQGTRTTGWLLMAVAAAAGGGIMYASSSEEQVCTGSSGACTTVSTSDTTLLLLGAAVAGAGIAGGIFMAMTPDVAAIQVSPHGTAFTPHALRAPGIMFSGTL